MPATWSAGAPDNAVTKRAAVLARLAGHRFPIMLTPEKRVLLETISRRPGPKRHGV